MKTNITERLDIYLSEGKDRNREMWSDTVWKDNKKGKLIAYWDDLGAYYDFNGTTWYSTGYGKWVNKGDTKTFLKQLKAGRWRGKLVESSSKFEVGKWIVQRRTDENEWALIIGQLKNGAWSVVAKSDDYVGGNAAKKSTKGWYPKPELANEKDVPPKIKAKIEKKAKQLGFKLVESSSLNEAMGYRMKAGDKKIIDAFIKGARDGEGPNIWIDSDYLFAPYMSTSSNALAHRDKSGDITIGRASGNVSQTWINYLKKKI